MTWFDRVINDMVYRLKPLLTLPGYWEANSLRQERGLQPLLRGLEQYYEHSILCYNLIGFDYAQPLYPYIHYIGPPQAGLTIPLPSPKLDNTPSVKEWLDDVQKRGRNVIYISTGTTVLMNHAVVKLLYSGIDAALNQRTDLYVLWQLDKQYWENFPYLKHDRLLVEEYLDQQIVVNHPAVKVFFSHCGINGVYESLLAGKPILALPFRHDQIDNAARIEDSGVGIRLDRFLPNLTPVRLVSGIVEILDNKNYTLKAQKFQNLLLTSRGAQEAVKVLEDVAAVGDAHLIPQLFATPWWYLDQEIGIYFLYLALLYSQFMLLRSLYRILLRRRKPTQPKDKSD
jgi:UDP:flavonoid glycosyltransferase YjiC (YdhE family)